MILDSTNELDVYFPNRKKDFADEEIEKLRAKIESLENEKDLLIDMIKSLDKQISQLAQDQSYLGCEGRPMRLGDK